nr:UDP-N-acetylmuramoyl-tripeptide--D-alanyl-D-alanine ligase [Bacteroidales bacterium]
MDISRIYDVFCQHPLICTDSRKIQKNCIFIALKGESFDGNQYAEDAIELGASYAIVDNPSFVNSEKYILVSNTLETLQQLALFHRKRFNIPVIAITGTNGKTTTKELIATVLAQKYKVLATKGNLNNHIGVPFTLFELNKTHEIAVIELGANHQGEITELCNLALPEYGIITNIGKAHLEGFGSFEGIIKAKTELFDFLRSHSGKVFINYDDDLLMKHAENLSELTYGSDKNADYRTEIVSNEPFLTLKYFENNNILNIHSQLIGTYNAGNISAAIAVGRYFGIGSKLIKDAISAYIPQNNRSQLIDTGRNQLILDAYNANPSSMEAALNNFIQNP